MRDEVEMFVLYFTYYKLLPSTFLFDLNVPDSSESECVYLWFCTWCVGQELVGHVGERQDSDHAVISISLNEVVPCDGRRVDVVLPEWTDKRLHARCDTETGR